jgi:hypothetical protein
MIGLGTNGSQRCWPPVGAVEAMKQFRHHLEEGTLISSESQRTRARVVSFE